MDGAAMGERKKRKKKRLDTRMEYVPKKEGFGNPYVAVFPSGFDPLQEAPDKEENMCAEIVSYRNPKPMSRQQELVIRTQEDVDFVGSNYSGEAAGWQPCEYLLGVFDKEKGSLKLMPLAGEKVFRMEPRVRGMEYGRDIDEDAVEEEEDAHERSQKKKRLLTEAFGSQRSRLRASRRERAQVKEEDLGDFRGMESLFQDAAQNEGLLTTEQAMEQANTVGVRNIPPYDLAATTPQAAYPLENIITPNEWSALDVAEIKSAAMMTNAQQSSQLKASYPPFVLSRLKRLRTEGDAEGNERRAHILVYLKHLLAFYSAPHSMIRRAADPWATSAAENTVNLTERLGIPGALVAKFLEVFTAKGAGTAKESRGCERNKEQLELTLSYVLVLGLMVDEFQADPFDLASELKLTVTQLRPHYLRLGCKIDARKLIERKVAGEDKNSGKLKWKVTLPVPLNFPKIANYSRKRGNQGR